MFNSLMYRILKKINKFLYPEIYKPLSSDARLYDDQEIQAFVYKDLDLLKKKQSVLQFATRHLKENETLFQDLRSLEKFDKYLKSIQPAGIQPESSPIPRHPIVYSTSVHGVSQSDPEIEYVIELDFRKNF
jgi:hypothetical protein